MCGLFGLHYSFTKKDSSDNIKQDIKILTKLSRTRGTDTFGISISSNDKENIFKINEDPLKALERIDYNSFIKENLNQLNSPLSINGQTD